MKGDVNMRFIGSKAALLGEIENMILENIPDGASTFLDLFAGTNVVGSYFKDRYTVYSNDLLYFSYVNAKATIENNKELMFNGLKKIGIDSVLDYLSSSAEEYALTDKVGYYEANYTPTGNAMYLTADNGKRIDFIRDEIDNWYSSSLINKAEYYYLISVLINAIPYVSNITGTYGAYLKHWDKRALNSLNLEPIEVLNNNKDNKSFNEDANQLIKKVSADITYIDTPYNTRQYASNYHLLENVALNQKPELKGKTRLFNWSKNKSRFAIKTEALSALKDLINNIDTNHIILSYNTDGIISEEQLEDVLKNASVDGKVVTKRIPYRKYVSKIASKNSDVSELLFYIRKKNIETKKTINVKMEKKGCSIWKTSKKEYIKSPLNYIGGKYRILNQIMPLFPKDIKIFVDLFSGGGNVGINVKAEKYFFNDMNYKINEMFRYFSKEDPESLILSIKKRISEYKLSKENELGYLSFRKAYNAKPNPLDLYVLTSFSYNYQLRFNNSMEFNNPFGRNRSSFSSNMEENLKRFIGRLKQIDATFTDDYFSDFNITELTKKDFVYLDPPYLITTGNYNDGNRGFLNWSDMQEQEMYKLMDKLSKKGVKFALSNVLSHKGKVNNLLLDYIKTHNVCVNHLKCSYNNSSYNSRGTGSEEVLITNYDPLTYRML